VWDPATKTVALRAARNEFTAFQLVIEADQPREGFDIQCAGLQNDQGVRIAGRNLAVFKEWYTQVRRPPPGMNGLHSDRRGIPMR